MLSGLATKQRAAADLFATSAPAFTRSLSNMEGQRRPQSPFASNWAGLDIPSDPLDSPEVLVSVTGFPRKKENRTMPTCLDICPNEQKASPSLSS